MNKHILSADRRTLVIELHLPEGIQTATYHRQDDAGPFTDADVAAALRFTPSGGQRQPGQRSRTRRTVTRFGILWTHVFTGPPTWWRPQARRENDGTLMAGWLRLAIAVRFDRPTADARTMPARNNPDSSAEH
jgi:hypothetical protein